MTIGGTDGAYYVDAHALFVLAHLGLGDIDAATAAHERLQEVMTHERAITHEIRLVREASRAIETPGWAREESAERLRLLAEKARAADAGPLDPARV